MARLKTDGKLEISNFNRSNFRATRSTDKEILENIRRAKADYDYVVDPHTACAIQGIDPDKTNIILATAHPAKFPDVIKKAIGETPTEESLEALKKKRQKSYPVEATGKAIREFIEKHQA